MSDIANRHEWKGVLQWVTLLHKYHYHWSTNKIIYLACIPTQYLLIWDIALYFSITIWIEVQKKLKLNVKRCSRYRSGVAQRVGTGIALLFHDRGTRRGWVVSSTPRPHFTTGKDPVPILQEAGWAPGPVWTGGKSRPHRDSIPDRPTHVHLYI